MKPRIDTDDSTDIQVFPCCLPPVDEGCMVSGAVLYPSRFCDQGGVEADSARMRVVWSLNVKVGAKHPPMVEIEA